MHRYFIIYKPYLVLSQFSPVEGKKSLSDFFHVPKDVYPVGRLDYDSEGLLLLTNDKKINNKLLDPAHKHEREYWVQVEGEITTAALEQLHQGVRISVDGKVHTTLPCIAKQLASNVEVPHRNPPIRFRKAIPTSWISLVLTEGKNRQVRRMTAAVGFPTLRLIRQRIEGIELGEMQPADMKELSEAQCYQKLFHKKSST